MSFEATKQLRGARLLVEAMGMELDSISAYSSPRFDKIAVQGGTRTTDRVSQMVIRKESMIHSLMNAIEACQHLESASKAELETVHDLEMRAKTISGIWNRTSNGWTRRQTLPFLQCSAKKLHIHIEDESDETPALADVS